MGIHSVVPRLRYRRQTADIYQDGRSGIPMAPGAVPVLGHAWRLGRDPMSFLDGIPRDADIVRVLLGPHPIALVCDPELTQQMLKDDRTFDKGGPLISIVSSLVGDGIVTCPRSRHRPSRRLVQPDFRPDRYRSYARKTIVATSAITRDWRNGQAIDVPVELRRIAIHASVKYLFSDQINTAQVDQMAEDFTTIQIGFAKRMQMPPFLSHLPTPLNRAHDAAIKRTREVITSTVLARRANPGDQRQDLLSTLLTNGTDDKPMLEESVLEDHVATFLIASTATVSSVLGWALHHLAQDPQLQHRLHHELDSVLNGSPAGFDDLPQLGLTRAIVTEATRMYPSLWLGPARVTTADTQLGDHFLPAGTEMAYSPYVHHRRDELYDDPHTFDPDRWTDDRPPHPAHHASVAYGGGARQCIAVEWAPIEMALTLATIASRWALESVPGRPLRSCAAPNLTARGLQVRVSTRTRGNRANAAASTTLASMAVRSGPGTRRPTNRATWLI
ncbi:cytochrome P450 [Amycolatopsis antarctica]|uniref:Cytochrome P450 n=1 Tax=Amycolatopsis antarctica TaxID=1854586 RepID=A0A263D135_9PSEU|nr:cytochrome P450 [Amycolatopsis antarctica]OZM72153.1 cytochrome P450 [Amycolatopsis antarctica]